MSRRDTIIIAVLVNAGLLLVLFASALKSNSSDTADTLPSHRIPKESLAMDTRQESRNLSHPVEDELDQALKKFHQDSSLPNDPMLAQQVLPASDTSSVPASGTDPLQERAVPPPPPSAVVQLPKEMYTLVAPAAPLMLAESEFMEFKVKKGDVLEKIARQHRTTVAELMKINKLTSSNLRIGQILKIPHRTIKKAETSTIAHAHSAPSAAAVAVSTHDTAKYYTIKQGDNPWMIAVKHHLKVEQLLRLNNMNDEQARRLKPGDQIRIQ